MDNIHVVEKLRFWCNKILPLVYDESLSYYELLCKVTQKLNELIEQNNEIAQGLGDYIEYWLTTPEGQAILQEIIAGVIDQNYDNLVTRMGVAEGEIDALQSDVGSLDTTVAGHTTSINSLNSKIKLANGMNLSGGNIVFFGDSWTVGGSAGSTDNRWTTITAKALKMTEFNYGIGGAGFAISNKILAGVNSANSAMTTTQKNNTTLVVITGGVNDARNWSSQSLTVELFYNGVADVVAQAHTVFPNALICLGIGSTIQYGTTDTYKHAVTYTNRNIASRSYPVFVIDNMLNWVSNTNWYQTEAAYPVPIHLSATGHKMYADYMINALLGGGTNVYNFLLAISWDSTYINRQEDAVAHLWRYNERMCITNTHLYFNGTYTGNHTVATLPQYAAPQANIYAPIYSGNLVIGAMALTSTGNLHLIVEEGVSSLFTPELTWRAY